MEPLAIALVVIGLLAAIVGGIMLLVAAFREGLMWGLAYLFVPLAGLVFVVVHWDTARRGFLLNLLGVCVVIGGLFASPAMRKSVAENLPVNLPMLEKEKPADLTPKIDQLRVQIETCEAQFQQQGAALTQQYKALDARRAALKSDDTAGVTAYNAEAATYQQANAGLKQLRQQIDTAQQELSTLLDERARQKAAQPANKRTVKLGGGSPAAPKTANRQVVIYTTSRCGWCTKAKQYFARKGVRYEERDVERSPEARAEFERLGGRGVPLIMVGTEKMDGFNEQRLNQLL